MACDRATKSILPCAIAAGAGLSLSMTSCWLFSSFGDLTVDGTSDAADSSVDAGTSKYAAVVMADSPALYLRLGETRGPVAVDEMHASNGAYFDAGVTYGLPGALAGDPNTAVAFDGKSGIRMPPGLDFSGTAPYTVELWANLGALRSGDDPYWYLVDHQTWKVGDTTGKYREGWDLYINWPASPPGTLVNERNLNVVGTDGVSSTGAISTGRYHYLVVTFDSQRHGIYVDDQLQTEVGNTPLPSLLMSNDPWFVGITAWGGQGLVGSLDELAIYTKPLSTERIHAHYLAAR
jgi:hypothetical protein